MARQFNYIYNKLVKNDNDLIGHIAYSLYKKKKQQFLDNWKKEHPEEEIEEDVLDTFHKSESTKESISEYKVKAKGILQNFFNNLLQEETTKIEEACKLNQEKILKEIINRPSFKQYLHGTFQSVLGAFLFAIIIAVISFILCYGKGSLPITIILSNNKGNEVSHQNDINAIQPFTNDTSTLIIDANEVSIQSDAVEKVK